MSKTLGILGGMGPEAGALFYQKVVAKTPATRDQDHLRTILLSDPSIPDRSAAILQGKESPSPALCRAVQMLESFGAEVIAVPCNTAHVFWKEMQEAVRIPVLHIVKETVREVAGRLSTGSRVAVLATEATLQAGLYQDALAEKGFQAWIPDPGLRRLLHTSIYRLKAQAGLGEVLGKLRHDLERLGPPGLSAIILGCTELGLLTSHIAWKVPVVDSLEVLAARAVEFCLGEDRVVPQSLSAASIPGGKSG